MLSPACCSGHQDTEGTPAGKEVNIGGLLCYVTEPATPPKHGVLFCSDAFGLALLNNKLLCDRFAKQTGAVVILPDVFQGTPLPPEVLPVMDNMTKLSLLGKLRAGLWIASLAIPFLWRHGKPAKRLPSLRKVMAAATQQYGLFSWGALGYCYGGKLVAALAGEAGTLAAGAVAHPSFLAVPGDIAPLDAPMLFCCAGLDNVFTPSQAQQAEQLLAAKAPGMHKFVRYPGVKHGFAVRGGTDDADARENAFGEMVAWLGQHLTKAS